MKPFSTYGEYGQLYISSHTTIHELAPASTFHELLNTAIRPKIPLPPLLFKSV